MDDRSAQIKAVIALFIVLTWIAVPLRCYVRLKITKSFATDDWLTVLSLALFTVFSAFVIYGAHEGTGRHITDLSLVRIEMAMKSWFFGEIFYILTCTFLRLAVGYFLLRLVEARQHRAIIHTLNGVNIIFNIYFLCVTIFQCSPPENFWTTARTVNCRSALINVKSTFAQSAICAFIDWAFALLPIYFFWHLNMNTRKKMTAVLVLSLGALASTAPLIRIPTVVTLAAGQDFLWVTTDVVIWSSVEPGLGLTVICLASFRPLFRKNGAGMSEAKSTLHQSYVNEAATKGRGSKEDPEDSRTDDGLDLELTSSNIHTKSSITVRAHEVADDEEAAFDHARHTNLEIDKRS